MGICGAGEEGSAPEAANAESEKQPKVVVIKEGAAATPHVGFKKEQVRAQMHLLATHWMH